MKIICFGIVVLFLGINLVSALAVQDFEVICNHAPSSELENFEIPSYVPYSDEVFNFYIEEENLSGNFIIAESKFDSIACEENENPTYNIYIQNLKTIEDLKESENAFETYNEKINNNEIEIKGVTFGKKFKMVFTKLILKIVSWFK